MGEREELYGLFFEVQATCQLLYRDLEAAVDELVTVRAEAEARLDRLRKALGWAEQLARKCGKEMTVQMEERLEEHVVLGGRKTDALGAEAALDAAISRAQAAMANPRLDGNNPAFKGSRFASLAEVRNAVVPALAREGVSVTQHPTLRDGRLHLRTRLAGFGASLESTLELKVTKDDPQGVGSAITYARRYALAAIACVAGDDDDDAEGAMPPRGNAASVEAPKRLQDASWPPKATTPAPTPQKPSAGQPEASAAVSGTESPEAFEKRIAQCKDLEELGKVGSALSQAPREVRDWCRDKFQQKMSDLSKKESKK